MIVKSTSGISILTCFGGVFRKGCFCFLTLLRVVCGMLLMLDTLPLEIFDSICGFSLQNICCLLVLDKEWPNVIFSMRNCALKLNSCCRIMSGCSFCGI